MLGDLDFFVLYRWALATVCAIYAAVRSGQSLWRWLGYFSSSRHTAVLGRYAGILLLRLKIRRFTSDFCQIALLLLVLGCVVYWHRVLNE